MKHIRIDALTSVLDDLEAFKIDLNQYYDDAEPQGIIDVVLTGKIETHTWLTLLPRSMPIFSMAVSFGPQYRGPHRRPATSSFLIKPTGGWVNAHFAGKVA